MAFVPEPPFPKSRGDSVRSRDWNDLVNEALRLDADKVNRAGDALRGPLSVAGTLGVGTTEPKAPLEVRTSGAGTAATLGLSTANGNDFLAFSGGRSGNQNPHIVWRRGSLRLGTATSFGGQAFSEKLRITSDGKVGIGTSAPAVKLEVKGEVRGNQKGALRIATGHGWVDVGPKNANWSHFYTDRPKYYFDKEVRVDSGKIGSYDQNLELRTEGTTRITVLKTNGFVGIGTASPNRALTVQSAGGTYMNVRASNGTHEILMGADSHGGIVSTMTNHDLVLRCGGNKEKMRIKIDGKVGVGTGSPTATLDVNGDFRVRDASSVGNIHLFLGSQIKKLWNNKGGGDHVTDVAASVPATAKGAVIKVIVSPKAPRTTGSFVCADRNGGYSGSHAHYLRNGFTNYVTDKWIGGMVLCPFYSGKKFRWRMASNESSNAPDNSVFSYASLIGWF